MTRVCSNEALEISTQTSLRVLLSIPREVCDRACFGDVIHKDILGRRNNDKKVKSEGILQARYTLVGAVTHADAAEPFNYHTFLFS